MGLGSTFQRVLARVSDADLFARLTVSTNTDFHFVVPEGCAVDEANAPFASLSFSSLLKARVC
jgi:hypothetical protein